MARLICNRSIILPQMSIGYLDIEEPSILNRTPLHFAAVRGKVECVNILINNQANVNAVDCTKDTPLSLAVRNGYEEIVKILLRNKANPSGYKVNGFIERRSHAKKISIADVLKTEARLMQRAVHGVPLINAVQQGSLKLVNLLLKYGANTAFRLPRGQTILHFACSSGNAEIIKALIDKNAGTNAWDIDGKTPFHCAIISGKIEALKVLKENKANIQSPLKGLSPLHLAIECGQKDAFYWLLPFATSATEENIYKSALEFCYDKLYSLPAKDLYNKDNLADTYKEMIDVLSILT